MNEIQIFKNEEFGEIRTLEINGQVYFVGADVAKALGYANTKDAINTHVDEEDRMVLTKKLFCNFLRSQNTTLENFPNRGLTIINESGLYSLILSSKLDSAKKFKHWVTSEVLPTIRRTGTYGVSDIEGIVSRMLDERIETIVSKVIDEKIKIINENTDRKA
ncbi:MAG: phage antirepressor, partial [Ruminococcus sp.]|nr:phage antirepressor [Ruminococcus sp.]